MISRLILLFLLIATPAYGGVGVIKDLSGTVYFRAKGEKKWGIASKDREVSEGDGIRTGPDGRVLIELRDGSRISMGNSSEMRITRFLLKKKKRTAVFSISRGKVRAVVSNFFGRSNIRFRTPTGIAGIKGTEFIILNEGKANVFFGKEDRVEVSGTDGRTVILLPDMMTENTRGEGPIEPVKVEPGSMLEEVRTQLEAITDVRAPVEWEKAGLLPDILARWNINYGHYLADSQRFEDALGVFQIAIDLSSLKEIKAEAHLERGTVLSRNLNAPERALTEYMTVIEQYPELPHVENALFSAGMIQMELGNNKEALELFKRYLSDYPQGRHAPKIRLFIRELEKER